MIHYTSLGTPCCTIPREASQLPLPTGQCTSRYCSGYSGLPAAKQRQFDASSSSFAGLKPSRSPMGHGTKTAQSDAATAPHIRPIGCSDHPHLHRHTQCANQQSGEVNEQEVCRCNLLHMEVIHATDFVGQCQGQLSNDGFF